VHSNSGVEPYDNGVEEGGGGGSRFAGENVGCFENLVQWGDVLDELFCRAPLRMGKKKSVVNMLHNFVWVRAVILR
jgi:hypothetical protein